MSTCTRSGVTSLGIRARRSGVGKILSVVGAAESTISTIDAATGFKSDDVLKALGAGLAELGFAVETAKTKDAKIRRPVLFGENGTSRVAYEIDAFHDELGIAVEVEAGRGAHNNADYRDIVRTSLILDAKFLALLMPINYRYSSSATPAYRNTLGQLDAIYASDRLKLPFHGVLLVGY
ncbi:hypothetical protein [Mycolicibacterium gadium]|uniref:Uncharacterized protein n=1 Tax=Mycolicibacterium gadium TaxID=1794 RepID=A0A7I7WVR7_MYCGU|nr:hypothetical protein [Mycolicibacterium gadium]BBZ20895.1 hypothetical protein MGAD_52300 [Mycolicibacterium gadium]